MGGCAANEPTGAFIIAILVLLVRRPDEPQHGHERGQLPPECGHCGHGPHRIRRRMTERDDALLRRFCDCEC